VPVDSGSPAPAPAQRVPAAAEGGIKSIVNGPITFTPDANPLIGPAFGLRNAWLLTGSSMGVMEGGGAGRMLAEWMDGGEPPMDALAVDARRFGAYADRDYRVAKAVECFAAQFGIHYPYEERPAARECKLTPAFEPLQVKGAVFGSVYGFERPNWFSVDPTVTESTLSFRRANWFDAVAAELLCEGRPLGLAGEDAQRRRRRLREQDGRHRDGRADRGPHTDAHRRPSRLSTHGHRGLRC